MHHTRTPIPVTFFPVEPFHQTRNVVTGRVHALVSPIVRHRRLIVGNLIALAVIVAVVLASIWLFSGETGAASTPGLLPTATDMWSAAP